MEVRDNNTEREEKFITRKDFYNQACSYFYYHAEQRTTMINYFIAVFGAALALYGSLIKDYVWASVLISVFLILVSVIFFMIDLRNKFDVKESENVIRQIESDCGVDKARDKYAYGVFSNETNVYKYYGYGQRRAKGEKYKELRAMYKKVQSGEKTKNELESEIRKFIGEDEHVSVHEIYQSLGKGSIIPLSFCIKLMYIVCTVISVLALVFALLIACGVM